MIKTINLKENKHVNNVKLITRYHINNLEWLKTQIKYSIAFRSDGSKKYFSNFYIAFNIFHVKIIYFF